MAAKKSVTKSRSKKTLPSIGSAPKRAPAKAKVAKRPSVTAKPATTLAATVEATARATVAIARRDATGHLNPKYAADLRAMSHASADDVGTAHAFLRTARAHDALAEELGEEAVLTMTSGEDQSSRLQDMEVEEESGGPFVITSAREELARGTDESNPADAYREPFPTT